MSEDNEVSKADDLFAAFFIGIYAVFYFLIFHFILTWDNKGTQSMWAKSMLDWSILLAMLFIGIFILVSIYKIYIGARETKFYWWFLATLLVAQSLYLVIETDVFSTWYMSIPSIFLGIGLWVSRKHIGSDGVEKH